MRWLLHCLVVLGVSTVLLGACGSDGDGDPKPDAAIIVPQSCGDTICDTGTETCSNCPGDCGVCPDACGNGTCELGEACYDCPSDCGQCACTRGDGSCTGETVCITGACEAAFGRIWSVAITSGTVPTTKPNGDAWDFGSGAPDLFVDIEVNGSVVARTSTAQDTFAPAWNEVTDVNLVGGSTLTLRMWDEDATSNDVVFGCTYDPITAGTLRAGIINCDFATGTLTGRIDPK